MKQNTKFLNTLISLLSYHTYSRNEGIMKDFVIKQLQSLGFKYMVDAVGNISAVRGKADTYPMLNAHMDIVYSIDNKRINVPQHTYKTTYSSKSCNNCENEYDCAYLMRENEQITLNEAYKRLATRKTCESYVSWSNYYDNDSYFSSYVYDEDRPKIESQITDLHKINFDSKTGKLSNNKIRVLGGDDKCGIALALQVAREMPKQPLKILFTVQEETGGQGIEYFIEHNKNWFNDVKYCLTLDRRGSDNLILHACGQKLCERAFGSKIAKIGIETGIDVVCCGGLLADVIYISQYVENCVNMPAGYYNPHSTDEYIEFYDMLLIRDWVKNIITTL